MRTFLVILCSLAVTGCNRDADPAAIPAPSTRAAAAPAEPSTLEIEGLVVHFPAAKLRAQATGGGVTVDLSTPTADPTGDRIDLSMTLDDIDDPADLNGAAWSFHTEDPERDDTLNRVTLREPFSVLEPVDVRVVFGREGDRVTIEIEGQFRWYDPPDAEKPARVVGVTGKLYAPALKGP